jgi:uncharacterized phage-like protein YoqJ
VNKAINDGYTRFVTGVEGNADMIFAEAVYDMKNTYPDIKLEIEIPGPECLDSINNSLLYQRLFLLCDAVTVTEEKESNNISNSESGVFADIRYIDL